ncbi:MAG: hypothetical protein KOO69_02485, partial [Victivallales bacterium]|nr:hypothetical protein [Victivallales bacterium]
DYDVSTTLSIPLMAGDEEISLASNTNIFDNTTLKITEDATTEYLQLLSRDGLLKTVAENSFTTSAVVSAVCQTKIETYSDINVDPVCGIVIAGWEAKKEDFWKALENAVKLKRYLGVLTIVIYIECSSKEKALQLASEYEKSYGDGFGFLLNGDRVEIYMSDNSFVNDNTGEKPKIIYEYKFQPSSVTIESRIAITNFEIDVESVT